MVSGEEEEAAVTLRDKTWNLDVTYPHGVLCR